VVPCPGLSHRKSIVEGVGLCGSACAELGARSCKKRVISCCVVLLRAETG
jgi:hypothetical protein